jgi:putative OPT family oligopeptide transporter
MTICTVLFASGMFLLFGMSGTAGIIAVLGIAGVVCCAACTAGDVSQDLKTGYLVGATPWKQQWTQVLGVLVPAFIIAPVLTVLHVAYGIGDELRAPQATLFASLAETIFRGGSLPWGMIASGAAIGIAIVIFDCVLRARRSSFRAYVMPVAVGIYLPIALSTPILLGGVVSLLVGRAVRARQEDAAAAQSRGLLFSSGLVAGEAVTGVIVATLIFLKLDLPVVLVDSALLSLALFAAVTWTLARLARGK